MIIITLIFHRPYINYISWKLITFPGTINYILLYFDPSTKEKLCGKVREVMRILFAFTSQIIIAKEYSEF